MNLYSTSTTYSDGTTSTKTFTAPNVQVAMWHATNGSPVTSLKVVKHGKVR